MKDRRSIYLPIAVGAAALILWHVLCAIGFLPNSAVPSPASVLNGFLEEARRGRLFDDLIASLFRVSCGFLMAVALGIPLGLFMGLNKHIRAALLPGVNFFRSLSPLAWIPFAILWFGIGDKPAIFLIFMAAFFPIVLSTAAAVASIPQVYFRVARDYGFRGMEFHSQVTIPAIMPQVITTLRVTAGLSWLVVVAAEMIAGQDGLGFLIWDARNALRPDLLVVGMVIIGIIGVILDRILAEMTKIPSIRWGYDK